LGEVPVKRKGHLQPHAVHDNEGDAVDQSLLLIGVAPIQRKCRLKQLGGEVLHGHTWRLAKILNNLNSGITIDPSQGIADL